jgi:hypothetical protein
MDPYNNPPGWTDPYADPTPPPPQAPFQQGPPHGQPPGSPLLTGLILLLLLVAVSVGVFQLFGDDGDTTAAPTTTLGDGLTTPTEPGTDSSTTLPTDTTLPLTNPYPAVDPPIAVDRLKMIADGIRVNDNAIDDIVFGQDAATAIGRFVASFGEPIDTGWQTSTGAYGVCPGDLERVLTFGTFAAIVTNNGGQEVFNGYRNDVQFGDISLDPAKMTTLSGLSIGDTVQELRDTYVDQAVSFVNDPRLGPTFEVRGATSGSLLLWGPVDGEDAADAVIGIYAPDVCGR